jgi:hypothetical protein
VLHICNGSLNRCCRGVGLIRLLSGHEGHIQALFRRRLSVLALAPGKDVASYVSTYDLSTTLVMEIVPVGAPIMAVVAQITAVASQVVSVMTNVTAVAASIAMVAVLNVMAQVATITFYIAPILSAVRAVVPNIPPVLADVVTER